jgi:hypothetical protein
LTTEELEPKQILRSTTHEKEHRPRARKTAIGAVDWAASGFYDVGGKSAAIVGGGCKARNETILIGVAVGMEGAGLMEMPKQISPQEKQHGDEALSFDRTAPPAPVDVHAFARRAGEIIARAARASLGKGVKR